MISKLRGSVSIPKLPRGVGNLLKWSREVNQCLQQLRDRVVVTRGGGGSGGSSASTCPFGEIIDVDEGGFTKAIRGGAMLCGDKNFNLANRGINLAVDSSTLVKITLTGIEFATDDDEEIFLPGVVTASGTPSWGTVTYTGSESYTSNTNPSTPAGTGTIVIPIGVLKVVSGVATFTPTGCGTIRVSQCAGILSHDRG
jgi:hypothetical protein